MSALTRHTSCNHPSSAGSRAILEAIGRVARATLLWPLRLHANRQLLRQMQGMSDHELSDIGLSRNDLADTSALPLDSEVGAFLAVRARDRRRR